jgi:putative inorganic carbon (HCO3(-)) transporter
VCALTRQVRDAWTQGEERLGRQWPVWILGLLIYAGAGFMIMTRFRIPTILHLVVFMMAGAVLSVTALKIEWGVFALGLILPFSRPGVTIGSAGAFQISAFNFAVVGVSFAYLLRYLADPAFADRGPLVQRTRVDPLLAMFGVLVVLSTINSLNLGHTPLTTTLTFSFLKEQLLYFLWFYLLVTVLRTPGDVRTFAFFFAVAGLIASFYGMALRLTGGAAAITPGTMQTDLEVGAGGRMGGGWLGIGHPNMFAALLLMTVPIWFFAVGHLKHGFRRIVAEIAVINGFLGLLFTYSRSAWIGSVLGMGLVGLADRRALSRIILFAVVFAIAAQSVLLFTMNVNLGGVVMSRFQQFQESDYSNRPQIYESAISLIGDHPWLGVGLGAFEKHAPATPMGWTPQHAHNVFLAYAAETGIPAAIVFLVLIVFALVVSVLNLRRIGRIPGYGFVALGSCGGLVAVTSQMMAVQVFHHRILGFGLYAVLAIVVSLDRLIREGEFERLGQEAGPQVSRLSPWIEE